MTQTLRNKSDVLFGLAAERVGELVKIVFDSAIDLTWHVLCQEVTLTDVVPCGARGDGAI